MKDKQPGRNRKTLETRGYSPKLNYKLNIEDIIRLKETEEEEKTTKDTQPGKKTGKH